MTPKPLPPDQIKPLPLSVGIEEGHGAARKPLTFPDVTISATPSVLDRYYIEWAGATLWQSGCTRRMTLWGARRKARRMQLRIDRARRFNGDRS